MDEHRIRELFAAVQRGELDIDGAVNRLRHLPFEDLGFARVDHHRALRLGFPEVVFGQGKSEAQLVHIVSAILDSGNTLLVTRLGDELGQALVRRFSDVALTHNREARCLYYEPNPRVDRGRGPIAVVSAGTSDQPVAEEAAITAELMGNEVKRLYDVGIAGIHRLFAHYETLTQARVIVVVAGMEGALPSVVGGLVARPVIGVPTSVGYGASRGGMTPLLAMLTSCAAGVTVVNIDNGFGAGYAAALMNRASVESAAAD